MSENDRNEIPKEYLLSCLMEECGEVIQIASKLLRHKTDNYGGIDNYIEKYKKLQLEYNDVVAIARMLELSEDESLVMAKRKKLKLFLKNK